LYNSSSTVFISTEFDNYFAVFAHVSSIVLWMNVPSLVSRNLNYLTTDVPLTWNTVTVTVAVSHGVGHWQIASPDDLNTFRRTG
jgi:hypothetical protein